jgi:hypothetical protein
MSEPLVTSKNRPLPSGGYPLHKGKIQTQNHKE